ncbi:deaminase/reductase [Intrasporangium oryzae NRRL B-24470]|uniref:Deaminase/reductase n=1 Tax=Intrasporangium oryzae NRRL B-24470 TaxID=1386089 RepID=W9GAS1_9MICO|nr:dihydrofolate reductase family protein [Intrasporangium oryzae]EWT02327.1 deaminase/reductase [Intrasporangium oryzae NRRL B-24470]
MALLVYTVITSLDGYVADAEGRFDWAAPDEEVHAFVNDLERPVGTYLYGRRLYETMLYWETAPTSGEPASAMHDYAAIWQGADKIVYSTTLGSVSSARTRLERSFDVEQVRALKAYAGRDVSVGGPHLAAEALRHGLVDEVRLLVTPVVVGGGTRALPDGVRLDLDLIDHRRFDGGTVFVRYATRS